MSVIVDSVDRTTTVEQISMNADGSGQYRELYVITDPNDGDKELVRYDQFFQVPADEMPQPPPTPMTTQAMLDWRDAHLALKNAEPED